MAGREDGFEWGPEAPGGWQVVLGWWPHLLKAQVPVWRKGRISPFRTAWHKGSRATLWERDAAVVPVWVLLCRHLVLGAGRRGRLCQCLGDRSFLPDAGHQHFAAMTLSPLHGGSAQLTLSASRPMSLCEAVAVFWDQHADVAPRAQTQRLSAF